MADLMREFWQAFAIGWTCWAMGVLLFWMRCRDRQSLWLSRGLLFLAPFVWTCFGVHATRENQELAAIVAAKKGEAIDDRIYLASVTRSDLGDGCRIEWEHYSNAGRSVRVEVSPGAGKTKDTYGQTTGDVERAGSVTKRFIPLPEGMRFGGNAYVSDAYDGPAGMGSTF